jgi:menaquinol-cytochrome c reductase iron-sulfur subunit
MAGIYGLLSVIAGSFGITSAMYLLRGSKQNQGSAWADAGDVSALKIGIPQKVTFERTRTDGWKISNQKDTAWVLRTAGGTLVAFSPLCTHLGCAYQWQSKAGQSKDGAFVCPCHGSTFSRTGDVITGPANRPLDRYAVKRKGTRLWLGPILPAQNLNA